MHNLSMYCYLVQNSGKYQWKLLRMPGYLFINAFEISCPLDGHRRSQMLKLGISEQDDIVVELTRRKLRWVGQILRKDKGNITKEAMF